MIIKIRFDEVNYSMYLQLLEKMVSSKKIKLSLIKRNIRIEHGSLYATALRLAREQNLCDEYIKALNILKNDIHFCSNEMQKKYLEDLFFTYLKMNPFQGERNFEIYKKDAMQELWSSLSV